MQVPPWIRNMGPKSPYLCGLFWPHPRVTWYSACASQKWAWSDYLKPKRRNIILHASQQSQQQSTWKFWTTFGLWKSVLWYLACSQYGTDPCNVTLQQIQSSGRASFQKSCCCYISVNKMLSCRRETARRFVSFNILLSHSRSLKVIRNDTVA